MKSLSYYLIFAVVVAISSCDPKKAPESVSADNIPANEVVKNTATASNPSGVDPATLPVFQFQDTTKDFGNIKEGDIVSYSFRFKNIGKSPLIISNASASCGCTVPFWPKDPITPGDTGSIAVSFNSAGKPGKQQKTVTVTANTEPSIYKLLISAEVEKKMDAPAAPHSH